MSIGEVSDWYVTVVVVIGSRAACNVMVDVLILLGEVSAAPAGVLTTDEPANVWLFVFVTKEELVVPGAVVTVPNVGDAEADVV